MRRTERQLNWTKLPSLNPLRPNNARNWPYSYSWSLLPIQTHIWFAYCNRMQDFAKLYSPSQCLVIVNGLVCVWFQLLDSIRVEGPCEFIQFAEKGFVVIFYRNEMDPRKQKLVGITSVSQIHCTIKGIHFSVIYNKNY